MKRQKPLAKFPHGALSSPYRLTWLCLFLLTASLCAVLCIPPSFADAPIYARLVMPIFFESEIPEDFDLIAKAVDQIAREKIGASLELVPLLYLYGTDDPLRMAALDMLSKQGVNMDIYSNVVEDIQPMMLDDLLSAYGQDILALIGEFRGQYLGIGTPIYRLDTMNDQVASVGLTMRADIVEKYSVDLSAIQSFADLDTLFAYISEKEPEMKMVSAYLTRRSLLNRFAQTQLVPSTILDVSSEESTKIVNYYATDAYRDMLRLSRKWYEAGYLPENLALQNIRASQLVSAGELFSYICAYKPGIDFEESQSCGMPMVTIPLMEPMVTNRSLNTTQWSIAASCANPGKAMQFLSLLYTDSELVNVLMYGIENIHYVRLEDGTIDYPEGITADTVRYQNTLTWLLPNQLVSYVWHGNDPQLWEKLWAFNKSAPVSDTLAFTFDDSAVSAQNARVNAALQVYAYGLGTGQLDPDVYLPIMLEEMKTAGADAVLEEAQRQFSSFLRERDGLE